MALPQYNTPIRQMAPLIVKRLRKAFPENLFQIDRVPSSLTWTEYEKRLLKQSPFIGVAFMGMKPDSQSGRVLHCKYQWSLSCVLRASGDLRRRFEGDSRDIGMDDIVDVAIAILHGANFKGIGSVIITGAESRYTPDWGDMAAVMTNIDFEIATELSYADLALESLEDFKGINAKWLVNGAEQEAASAERANGETNNNVAVSAERANREANNNAAVSARRANRETNNNAAVSAESANRETDKKEPIEKGTDDENADS